MGKYVFCCMDMMYEYNYNDNPMIFWNKYREKYHGLFELSKSVYIIQSSSCASVYLSLILTTYVLRVGSRVGLSRLSLNESVRAGAESFRTLISRITHTAILVRNS